jgi:hypothetical protein
MLVDLGRHRRLVWFNYLALRRKGFLDLRLNRYDGTELDATPYVRLVPWGAFPGLFDFLQGFPYDWRKDIDHEVVARRLKTFIRRVSARRRRRVQIVAQSLGGLVARRALQLLCQRKKEKETRKIVDRLVLLAPSTSGTLAAALGIAAAIGQLPLSQILPRPNKYTQRATRTWTALYQLLPWDESIFPSLAHADYDVRDIRFWRRKADCDRLSRAFPPGGKPWAAGVDTDFFADPTTMILGQVQGDPCQTAGGVRWGSARAGAGLIRDPEFDMPGDGFMAHCASVLKSSEAYIARGVDHTRMPMAPDVIQAVGEILLGHAPSCIPPFDLGKECPMLSRSGAAAAEQRHRQS